MLKAIAHPVRLMIMEALAPGERCVCELQEIAGVEISVVSKHLTIMREAGLVESERRGQSVYYSLRCPCVLGFLNCIDTVVIDASKKQQTLARACRVN